MRYQIAPVLAALTLLVACGGDDDEVATDETTTTTEEASQTTVAAEDAVAEPSEVAFVVAQIDDQLRRNVVDARPCTHGPREECEGDALDAYEPIARITGGAVDVLNGLADPSSDFYYGSMSRELAAQLELTVQTSAEVEARATAAVDACVPDFGDGCDAANEVLDAAIIELLKLFNDWRDRL